MFYGEMAIIKNMIFDMGNVLLDYNPKIPLGMYLDNVSDRTLIRKELFESEERILRDMGMITKMKCSLREAMMRFVKPHSVYNIWLGEK